MQLRKWKPLRTLLALTVVGLLPVPSMAAEPRGKAPPPARGDDALLIPQNVPVRPGQGRRVKLSGKEGNAVALLHAEVGDRRLVILPSGRLRSVPSANAPLSNEPFAAATKEQIAAEMASLGLADFQVRSTARYVYVYNTSDGFYKGSSRILETMYPAVLAYFKRLKLPVDDPQMPLVAIMFRTEAEFREFESVPPGVAAYYNTLTNWIVMYEQSDLVEVAPELAMKQSIGVIAHEGIHQMLHNIGVQQRLSHWPMWLSEGLAEYFAPTSVDRKLRWKGVGQPNDLRMHELQRFLQDGATKKAWLEPVVGAKSLNSSGYAAAWSLTHYLASREPKKFQDYLRAVARVGPLDPPEASRGAGDEALFVEHFGSDFRGLEGKVEKHLASLPYTDPIANQTHYVVLIDTTAMRSAGVTTSPASARRWQEETLSQMPAALRATTRFQVLPFANRELADQYQQRFLGGN